MRLLNRLLVTHTINFVNKQNYIHITQVVSHKITGCEIYNLISQPSLKIHKWFENNYKNKFKY